LRSITLFKGASYAARETDYDEDFTVSSSMTVSGVTEVVFDKLTGDPQATGSLTLTTIHGETAIVSLNAKGTVEF
jgi:hypothetical protein